MVLAEPAIVAAAAEDEGHDRNSVPLPDRSNSLADSLEVLRTTDGFDIVLDKVIGLDELLNEGIMPLAQKQPKGRSSSTRLAERLRLRRVLAFGGLLRQTQRGTNLGPLRRARRADRTAAASSASTLLR